MRIHPLSLEIRARKLGLLIRNAREVAGKTPEESARYLRIAVSDFEAFEMGESSPSLPQLEALADYYQVPLTHFWSNKILEKEPLLLRDDELETIQALRQRIIGALIRKNRIAKGKEMTDLSDELGLTPQQLEAYELGEEAIPLPTLEALALALGHPLESFFDRDTPLGKKAGMETQWEHFKSLPEEIQDFVCKPINRPYLELAQRLSEMSVEKLRAVAEGLLEITL
jgi:transcriptional regulator with XRE-family HTH domain